MNIDEYLRRAIENVRPLIGLTASLKEYVVSHSRLSFQIEDPAGWDGETLPSVNFIKGLELHFIFVGEIQCPTKWRISHPQVQVINIYDRMPNYTNYHEREFERLLFTDDKVRIVCGCVELYNRARE